MVLSREHLPAGLEIGKHVILMGVLRRPQEGMLGWFGHSHLGTAIERSSVGVCVALQNLEGRLGRGIQVDIFKVVGDRLTPAKRAGESRHRNS